MPTRFDFLTPALVRIRQYVTDEPPEQPLVRYGFFRDAFPEVPVQSEETPDAITVRDPSDRGRLRRS